MANTNRSRINRRNVAPTLTPLESLRVVKPIPSKGVDLSTKERAFLNDPDWITEDEADAIMSERIFRAEGGRGKPLRQYLKERGIKVEG
jgi:hypothetical protein